VADPSVPDDRFYGRRKGKALKPRMAELLETLYPSLRVACPPQGAVFDPRALFPAARETWMEIGFGGGEHLAHQAATHPDVGILGAEPFVNGIGKLLREIDLRGLTNVRIHGDDVRPLLDRMPDACLDKLFLLFPDPWPKTRHWKRRFMNPWVLDVLARVLKDGAEFRVASDDPTYQSWSLRVGPVHPGFQWQVTGPADWRHRWDDAVESRYEAKARRCGRTPVYLTFRRRPRAEAGC
jgi:tRNA (guanine-N7-)-methyltransferase